VHRLKEFLARIPRSLLVRYVRRPSERHAAEGEKVIILLVSAWGMGGTIRAALNLAGYLADHREVEIISTIRRREHPFFGEFPPGVTVTALADERPKFRPKGLQGIVYDVLRRVPSVLMHPSDRTFEFHSLWTDVQLVRHLRGRKGWLIATRPGWNLMAALLKPPGLATIGLEQMHLDHHNKTLRLAMKEAYPKLDAFVVLTDGHRERYRRHLKPRRTRLEVIPNTVRDQMDGPPSDPASKTIFTAGRLFYQKGFDLLIEAYAPVAAQHPDWKLRICGHGHLRERHAEQIERLGLGDVISLEPPAKKIGEDMGAASIFVLSSRFEGFPLILLEAMSKRMAVIAYDCPTGPGEIVRDHENGILLPPQDVPALTAALLEMISDEELRRRCGPAAEETAEDFKMHAIGPRWDALLDDLRK
jgi:glycosyltransferase involved in cell wall biosynthesis